MMLEDLFKSLNQAEEAAHTDVGVVTSTDPFRVRFFGDADPVRVYLKNALYTTPSVGDKIGLIKFGVQWVAAFKIEDAS